MRRGATRRGGRGSLSQQSPSGGTAFAVGVRECAAAGWPAGWLAAAHRLVDRALLGIGWNKERGQRYPADDQDVTENVDRQDLLFQPDCAPDQQPEGAVDHQHLCRWSQRGTRQQCVESAAQTLEIEQDVGGGEQHSRGQHTETKL
eukprot:SAG11_NODE_1917_length_4070_cov_3.642156_4_plen_146_part_00